MRVYQAMYEYCGWFRPLAVFGHLSNAIANVEKLVAKHNANHCPGEHYSRKHICRWVNATASLGSIVIKPAKVRDAEIGTLTRNLHSSINTEEGEPCDGSTTGLQS